MKTGYTLGVLFVCFCVQLVGGWWAMVYGRSLEDIKNTKEIRFCLAGSSWDFYKKNAMAFARFLGDDIQPSYIHLDKWNDQFINEEGDVLKDEVYTPQPLSSGQCDLYPNDLVRLAWREKKLAYILLFISRNTVIVNKEKANEYKNPRDLAGKTVAVMEGTSYQTWIEEQNNTLLKDNPVKIKYMPQEEAIKAVDSKAVDFAVAGADGALWAVKHFAPHSQVAFPVGKTTEYGWCFRKEDKDLQQAVQSFFDGQRASLDSELNANWKAYIGLTLGEFILFITSTP